MRDQARLSLFVLFALSIGMPPVLGATGPDTDGGNPAPIVRTWNAPRPMEPEGSMPGGSALRFDPVTAHLSANQDPEGDMPRQLAFTPDGTEVLVVQRDTDNLTFFDAVTRIPTHTVSVGDFPVDVAVTPDGKYAVIPNVFDNALSIVDVASHTVVATVPVTGDQPYGVAITPDSALAVVGVINDAVSSSFSVVDLNLKSEIFTFPSAPQGVLGWFWTPETGTSGNLFTQFALTPDGAVLVLPDRGGSRVLLYDRATGAELQDLATPSQPTAVDVSADGTRCVVSHEGAAKAITEVDLVTQTVLASWSVSDYLYSQVIRITPDKSHAVAAVSNNVIFVNLSTGATTAKLYTGTVGDLEISFDGQYLFVSNYNARVIDIAAQTIVKTISFAACADSAASPTDLRCAALNNRFREDVHFYNINGAAGQFEGMAPAGVPEEGDGTFAVDVAPDGRLAVACNVVSRNVCILDLYTRKIRAYVEVGDRPKEVRITPDGNFAVVCAMDAHAVVIIDLSTMQAVKTLYIYNRPGRVRISPDSQYAYVLNVAGTDRISFIHLDGANSSIVKQLSAGQTGSANGYTYTEISGIELSPDGATLAVCDSFNDLLRVYDTAAQVQVTAVAVGDFPIRAAFSPDGNRIYVTNSFSDDLTVVAFDGLNWNNIGTVPGMDFPLTVDVDPDHQYVYVGNAGNSAGVRVIDTGSLSVVKTILYSGASPRDSHLSPADGLLYTAATNGELVRITAAGPASAVLDQIPLSSGPADLAFCEMARIALFAQPVPDGADMVFFRDRRVIKGKILP